MVTSQLCLLALNQWDVSEMKILLFHRSPPPFPTILPAKQTFYPSIYTSSIAFNVWLFVLALSSLPISEEHDGISALDYIKKKDSFCSFTMRA